MKHAVNDKWVCSQDGACCDLFSEWALGSRCPQLKKDNSCGCYSTRPKVCRVDLFSIDGLDKDEYLIARCHLIHMLQKWRDEVGESKSTQWIINRICQSGIK